MFHIIHNNGQENITDAQVFDAVRILNEDFNRLNPDRVNVRQEFQSIIADVGIQFRLATKDPEGVCTNGITRTVSELTNDGTEEMKALINWPRNKYLNVWVAASADGAAGYTFRPGSAQWFPEEDGIVLQHTYTGSIGTGSASRSRALTHEVGHWINLSHTWGSSNEPGVASNCGLGDEVSDTPTTIGWTTCNLNGATCGSALDNVENYMDYSYCSKMFTVGQGARMIAALNNGTAQRDQLWQTSNLINTGVNGNATLCLARFTTSDPLICAGSTVQFTDASYHDVNNWNWSFPGGEPSTSTEQNPTVNYAVPGVYPVTLAVSDGSDVLSVTTEDLVVVANSPGASAPLVEGFETATELADLGWTVLNEDDDNGFVVTSAAAHTGTKSLRILNTAAMAGRIDRIVLPTMDLSQADDIILDYRYSFARRSSTNDDRLRVYFSNNCGETWSMRKQLRGSTDLATGSDAPGSFVPSASDAWGTCQVISTSSAYNVPNFRVRFEFESDGGNNLYLDDINLNGAPVGVEDLEAGEHSDLIVVPNPATSSAQAVLSLAAGGRSKVDVVDVLGRTMGLVYEGELPAGTRRFDLPVSTLRAGIYFVRVQQNGRSTATRFAVQ